MLHWFGAGRVVAACVVAACVVAGRVVAACVVAGRVVAACVVAGRVVAGRVVTFGLAFAASACVFEANDSKNQIVSGPESYVNVQLLPLSVSSASSAILAPARG